MLALAAAAVSVGASGAAADSASELAPADGAVSVLVQHRLGS